MKKTILIVLIFTLAASSCGLLHSTPEATATITPTKTPLPDPQMMVTAVPEAKSTAESFFAAWKTDDYASMYNLLSRVSRDSVSFDVFMDRYNQTAITLTLDNLSSEITSVLTNPTTAQVGFHIDYHTNLVGDLSRDNSMEMTLESGEWKIEWEEGMIFPDLRGGNKLVMDITVPTRGPIYDINGVPLAAQTDAYALGVVPAQVTEGYYTNLVNEFSRITGKTPQKISEIMKEGNPEDYKIIGEVPANVVEDRYNILMQYSGVSVSPYTASRFYYDGGIGPHTVGYVQPISAEEADDMRKQGYRIDERIGRLGIEAWGQEQLAGTRGASLVVTDAEGNALNQLAKTDALAANSIYTTFNEDFQYDLQRAIAGFDAAVVVLEMDTGRVVGMASSPTFDPNLLDYNNYNSFFSADQLYTNDRPMYNRASQGQYPLGSVFKLIGMAAALETGIYTAEDTIDCGYEFTELDGVTLTDWTLEKEIPPSGVLTLSEGIMRSCNPWFYKIGLELYRQIGPEALPDMARAFGLGSLTGIGEIEEEPGNVETPPDEYSSVQLGIGQSTLLVTPLQVARFIAAIGNGGTLYRPQIVEQILDPNGKVTYSFKPEAQATLPVSEEHLKQIQDAMLSVTENYRGTAYDTFHYIDHKVYGKTGTAQTSPGFNPDAWFAGYTDDNNPEHPDIAIAVLVEYVGDGSVYAAPIFRRVLELYFEGKAKMLYNWEAAVYVTKTATPTATATKTPQPTRAPWETIEPVEETPEP